MKAIALFDGLDDILVRPGPVRPLSIGHHLFFLVEQVQPGNRQAQDLESIVKRKMEKEGLIGMAVVGGATLAFGALVGLGIAMAKRN